ncbi:MAG: lamin tail domain-containing protein [Planctomycetota bacterium]
MKIHTWCLLGALCLSTPALAVDSTGIIVISEIMYHPREGGSSLEYIELHNASPAPIDVSGWYFSRGISFTIPSGTFLEGDQYLVIARDAAAARARYGIGNLIGDWGNGCDGDGGGSGCGLDNGGETIELSEHNGIVHTRVSYNDRGNWPAAADGAGHSLEMTSVHKPQNDSDSWIASADLDGTPGRANTGAARRAADVTVVINEALVHTEGERFVELFNYGTRSVDLSGYHLADERISLGKATLPEGTEIPSRGFLSFTEAELGLDLSPIGVDGDEMSIGRRFVALSNPDMDRVLDAYIFSPEALDRSEARIPDGDEDFSDQATPTAGEANQVEVETNVVINEVMYHPIDENLSGEYIEIFNRGEDDIDMTGWRFTRGVNYDFPKGFTLAAGGYAVICRDPAHIIDVYGLDPAIVLGPDPENEEALDDFGVLRDDGERILLRAPDGNIADTVRYHDGGEWPHWPDGKGSSMELTDAWQDNRAASVWDASDDSAKAVVKEHEYIGYAGTGEPEMRFIMQGRGVTMIDDLRMFQRVTNFRQDSVILDHGAEWRYFRGTQEASDPVDAWRMADFNDSEWLSGPSPLGMNESRADPPIATEIEGMRQTDEQEGFTSLFIRTTFNIENEEDLDKLLLEITYDDGFIAYINGVRVTTAVQGNMREGEGAFDDGARSARERVFTQILLAEFRDILQVGENTLAIQGHNNSITSADFLLSPRIITGEFVDEDSDNIVTNGDFESTFRVGRAAPGDWFIEGNHVHSARTTVDPISGKASLKMVATGRGDNKVNRLETTLPALGRNTRYIISFKSRWVVGCERVLTQGHDQMFPHSHELAVPPNLGTPGARNSRAVDNAGPAIDKFQQFPALPAANEDTTLVFRVSDPDGVESVKVFYSLNTARSDQDSQEIQAIGPNADGLFVAVVPGQNARTRVVFRVLAEDTMGNQSRYPVQPVDRSNPLVADPEAPNALEQRFVVYGHNTRSATANADYQVWMHQLAESSLTSRRIQSNERVYGSFVHENEEIFHGSSLRFSGSPFARGIWQSLRVYLPRDEPLKGVIKKFNLEQHQGSGGRDARERVSHYLIRHNQGNTRAPYAYLWLSSVRVNSRSNILEHQEAPNSTTLERWFPDDDDGAFFEMDDRHTMSDAGTRQSSTDGRMSHPPYPAQASALRLPTTDRELYRWYFNLRQNECKDDYSELVNFSRLITRNVTGDEEFGERIFDEMNVDAFLNVWAIRLNTDDWDTWGARRGKNCYVYRTPNEGKWYLLPWDMELTYGNQGSFLPPPITSSYNSSFSEVTRIINYPPIKRRLYGIMHRMVSNQFDGGFLNDYRSRLQRRGLQRLEVMSGFIPGRRSRILASLRSAVAPAVTLAIRSNGGEDLTTSEPVYRLEGRAPVNITTILLSIEESDAEEPIEVKFSETDPLGWYADVPLVGGTNSITVIGFDEEAALTGTDEITITFESEPPVLESVEPQAVSVGDRITLRGQRLHAGLSVVFGDVPATDVDDSGLPESIDAVVPELTAGTVDVRVESNELVSNSLPLEIVPPGVPFIRGDVDDSGSLSVSDSVQILAHLFRAGPLSCEDAADTDDNGVIQLTDAIYGLNFLFLEGPSIPAPYPEAGVDETEDALDCAIGQ